MKYKINKIIWKTFDDHGYAMAQDDHRDVQLVDDLASRIEGLGGWVSVDDRLPADNVLVLAYSEKYNGTYPFLAYCSNGKWYDPDFDSDFNVISDPITSWIELPEPPKN